jgi:HEAT repeat protein
MDFVFVAVRDSLCFLAASAVVVFLHIIVHRLLQSRKDRRFAREYGRLERILLETLSHPGPDVDLTFRATQPAPPAVLAQLLIDYSRVVGGETREILRRVCDTPLREAFLRDLRSRRLQRRLRAARLFGLLVSPGDTDIMLRLLGDRPLVRLAAMHALSHVASERVLDVIFEAYAADEDANAHSYTNIFFGLGLRAEAHVRRGLASTDLSSAKTGLLIEVAGAIPLRSLSEEVMAMAGNPDNEIRVRVARALGGILLPESGPVLERLAADPGWEVQAQAVKSLGRLAAPGAAEVLERALSSKSWHVRLNACQALLLLQDEGIRRLRKVQAESDDRFAADIALMGLSGLAEAPGGNAS